MSTSDKDNGIIPATYHTQDNGDDEETAPAINQPNWQEEKALGECMLHVYESGMLADISFRCSDHVTGDTADRLRAHKMVMATRSAVFFAMFYGPNRDDSTEEIVSEFSKHAMDTFLRYLYSDTAPLEIGIAEDVFKIAHYYQVPKLVKLCCEFIVQNIGSENACTFLELALLYEQHEFRDNVSDFIDSNAKAILESDSFLSLSKDTLKYLLKGDTFHLEEITILKAVHAWATLRLTAEEQEVSGENIRRLLGEDLFYHIRMPTMRIRDFVKVEKRFNYHSKSEGFDILSFILNKNSNQIRLHCSRPRVRRFEKVTIKFEQNDTSAFSCTSTNSKTGGLFGQTAVAFGVLPQQSLPMFGAATSPIKVDTPSQGYSLTKSPTVKVAVTLNHICNYSYKQKTENEQITAITLTIPKFTKFNVPCALPVSYQISCPEIGYKHNATKNMTSGAVTLDLDPPLTLSMNDVTLKVEISPPPSMSFSNEHSITEKITIHISRPFHKSRTLRDDVADDDQCTLSEDEKDIFTPTSPAV